MLASRHSGKCFACMIPFPLCNHIRSVQSSFDTWRHWVLEKLPKVTLSDETQPQIQVWLVIYAQRLKKKILTCKRTLSQSGLVRLCCGNKQSPKSQWHKTTKLPTLPSFVWWGSAGESGWWNSFSMPVSLGWKGRKCQRVSGWQWNAPARSDMPPSTHRPLVRTSRMERRWK